MCLPIFDAEKKKVDKLKTEAEQKKKELTNIKSDKAVATTDLNTINGQIENLQSEINGLSEKLEAYNFPMENDAQTLRDHFYSVNTLAAWIETKQGQTHAG